MSNKWVPLHLHSEFSLLDGYSKTAKIADRCEKYEYAACALTDHGTVGGHIQFHKSLSAKGIKPILGCELYMSEHSSLEKNKDNRPLHHLVVLAKNREGWKNLARATTVSNMADHFYYKPRLSLDELAEFTVNGNLIAFSGHVGSALSNCLFSNVKASYRCKTIEEVRQYIHPDWKKRAIYLAKKHELIFGKGNFFIEIQLTDAVSIVAQYVIADMLREVSLATGIPCVATADTHYVEKDDAVDQRVLLCSGLKTTFKKVHDALDKGDDPTLGGFFVSSNYHLPSRTEIAAINTPDEMHNSVLISEMCENYSLAQNPQLPSVRLPDGYSSQHDYFNHLTNEGFKHRFSNLSQSDLDVYRQRLDYELGVLNDANLAGYFLIVQEFQQWARNKGWLLGPSRGSSGGSLVSYCLRITNIDPIENKLYFERFYNPGRNTATRISLPDIDCDFPAHKREELLQHIRDEYGHNHVAQICTYDTVQGKKALSEVFRAFSVGTFDEQKKITSQIPGRDKISDQLQDMFEAGETPSAILWTLENEPQNLKQWAELDKEGNIVGSHAEYFKQAIRLEGTKCGQSKHACGVIISPVSLVDEYPMIRDKSSDELLFAFEMGDAEFCGQPKFDILGLKDLQNIMGIVSLVNGEDEYD